MYLQNYEVNKTKRVGRKKILSDYTADRVPLADPKPTNDPFFLKVKASLK